MSRQRYGRPLRLPRSAPRGFANTAHLLAAQARPSHAACVLRQRRDACRRHGHTCELAKAPLLPSPTAQPIMTTSVGAATVTQLLISNPGRMCPVACSKSGSTSADRITSADSASDPIDDAAPFNSPPGRCIPADRQCPACSALPRVPRASSTGQGSSS
jgi:hypothetical protein